MLPLVFALVSLPVLVSGRSMSVNWQWNEAIRDDSYFAGIEGITSYALEGSSLLPTGVTFDAATGSFTGTPITVCSVGACIEKYSATIATDLDVSATIKVTVAFSPILVIDNQDGSTDNSNNNNHAGTGDAGETGLSSAVLTAIIVTAGILVLAMIVSAVYCFVSRNLGSRHNVRQIKLENSGFDYNQAVEAYPLDTITTVSAAPRPIILVNRSAQPAITPIKATTTVSNAAAIAPQPIASPATTIQTVPSPKPQQPQLSSLAFKTESYTAAVAGAAAATATPLSVEDSMPDEMQLWFAGNIRRTVCEQAVRNANHGDFIIRQSRGSDTFVLCVNDSGAPSSFQINVNDSDAGALKFEFAR
eukprot:gene9766-16202_t